LALDSLLTRLACCVRVEPALLRSLRLMHMMAVPVARNVR